jgi:uncharacterized protein (DUF1015 family)
VTGGSVTRQPTGLALWPFAATRYSDPARLQALTSPAYDLIEPAERVQLGAADPHSIVHLTLPTFGVEDAARRLALWRRDGVLRIDPTPALFVYEMADAKSKATGVPPTRGWIGAVAIPPRVPSGPLDAAPAPIVPHEATVAAVVADRLRLRAATDADLEPIVLAHDGEAGDADEMARLHVAGSPPIIDLVDGGGVRHRIWRVDKPEQVAAVCADMASRRAVIADGHHRYASATAHRDMVHAPAAAHRVLALLVPTGLHGPRVQAIHRVVPVLSLAHAAATAADAFTVEQAASCTDVQAEELLDTATDTLLLVTDGTGWLRLTLPQRHKLVARPEWQDLDVALADVGLITDRWAAAGSVLLRHAVGAAVASARDCDGVAVLLRPTPASTVLDLAARGVLMPRKSTFFVPKPRTGLLLRCFADEPDG